MEYETCIGKKAWKAGLFVMVSTQLIKDKQTETNKIPLFSKLHGSLPSFYDLLTHLTMLPLLDIKSQPEKKKSTTATEQPHRGLSSVYTVLLEKVGNHKKLFYLSSTPTTGAMGIYQKEATEMSS